MTWKRPHWESPDLKKELNAKAAGQKELFLVNGANHMDLCDGKGAEIAAKKRYPFFAQHLQLQTNRGVASGEEAHFPRMLASPG